jgi:hypothetical protein
VAVAARGQRLRGNRDKEGDWDGDDGSGKVKDGNTVMWTKRGTTIEIGMGTKPEG